jgi:hypothetical protein
MRVNVYNEEILLEYEFIEKRVEETGKTYFGWRVFLKSAPELHHTKEDDDRSAITFWFGTKERALNFLLEQGRSMLSIVNKAYMDVLQEVSNEFER